MINAFKVMVVSVAALATVAAVLYPAWERQWIESTLTISTPPAGSSEKVQVPPPDVSGPYKDLQWAILWRGPSYPFYPMRTEHAQGWEEVTQTSVDNQQKAIAWAVVSLEIASAWAVAGASLYALRHVSKRNGKYCPTCGQTIAYPTH